MTKKELILNLMTALPHAAFVSGRQFSDPETFARQTANAAETIANEAEKRGWLDKEV